MNNIEKLSIMDKIIRELEDINNSSTSLLKKVAQVETENINLGDKLLEDRLPDLHEKIDDMVTESATLITEYTEVRDKFYTDNNMGAATEGS
jgi:regulator of replication initiation timing